MKWLLLPRGSATYVDTPKGIFTDALVWFRTREAWLQDYASPVFARRSLAQLLAEAAVWLRSPQTLALWLLPPLLLIWRPLHAALASCAIYLVVSVFGPALVSRTLIPVLRVLEYVFLQALLYVSVLSYLAISSRLAAASIGLAGFIILRWGLLNMALKPLTGRLRGVLYRLPVPDHVLRAIIVRAALHYRVALPDFAPIEESIVQHLRNR